MPPAGFKTFLQNGFVITHQEQARRFVCSAYYSDICPHIFTCYKLWYLKQLRLSLIKFGGINDKILNFSMEFSYFPLFG